MLGLNFHPTFAKLEHFCAPFLTKSCPNLCLGDFLSFGLGKGLGLGLCAQLSFGLGEGGCDALFTKNAGKL